MKFSKVALAAIGYGVPERVVTSDWIEGQLKDVYDRLRLPTGRLEGMSGIRSRRVWADHVRLSDCSISSCLRAIESSGIAREDIGCLIHGSVCREFLEPATACRVHHGTGLPADCWVYDISNACLGILNGAVQIAQLIEGGAIRAGLVVGTEDSRGLLRATLAQLSGDTTLTRQSIKPAFASLTIGSGSCAWLLVERAWWMDSLGKPAARMVGAVATARTEHHALCQSDTDQAGGAMLPTMSTDSEQLLEAGIAAGAETFEKLMADLGWQRSELVGTVCHQVGSAHRRRILDALHLAADRDYANFSEWGNTGSVALPTALALALQSGFLRNKGRSALLGIGSGVNSVMIGLEMGQVAIGSFGSD